MSVQLQDDQRKRSRHLSWTECDPCFFLQLWQPGSAATLPPTSRISHMDTSVTVTRDKCRQNRYGPKRRHSYWICFRLYATRISIVCLTLIGLGFQLQAQAPLSSRSDNAAGDNRKNVSSIPTYVEVPAVNYYARGQETKIEFSSTDLTPGATGQARVKMAKEGSVSIDAQFIGLDSATKFGNEFLTYVLWASVPKGRTHKIGELILKGDRRQLVATTAFHTFAMVVTAEPYAAVTQPSSVVVLKGRSPGGNATETVSTQVELLKDAYAPPSYDYEEQDTNSGYAPELLQAMNARRIAKLLQADKYAHQQFQSAEDLYKYMMGWAIQEKKPSKQLLQVAKAVAESYEEARAVTARQQKNRREQ